MKVSGHLHILAALPLRKYPWYPLDTRMDELQSHYGDEQTQN
jgi:hypothetical protein